MTRRILEDSVNQSVVLSIVDDTDGTPETGVVWNTAGIDLWYRREGAAKVSITEATLASLTTAHTDGGFLTISNGDYRFDLPDAAFATGADGVQIGGTVTGMVVFGPYCEITTDIPQTADHTAAIADIPTVAEFNARTIVAANYGTGANQTIINDNVLLIPTTPMRGTDSAALAAVCTETRLAELDAANLPLTTDNIKVTTDKFIFTVANQVDSNALSIDGFSSGNLSKSSIAITPGAAIAGTLSITEMTTDLTETTNDHYNGLVIKWTSGVLNGQGTDITDYDGASKKLTYTATTEAPSATDTFVIL